MKKIFLPALLVLMSVASAIAKDGYRIQLRLTDTKDTLAFLAHYYGKPLPTIYKLDSARFKNGVATFQSKEKLNGGIYIIMLSDHKTYFELLLDNGEDMEVDVTTKKLPEGLAFKNSKMNDDFMEYSQFIKKYGESMQSMQSELTTAKTRADSEAIAKKIKTHSKELVNYRRDYIKSHPGTLLSSIFGALELPQDIPEGKHYLPDGTVDSMYPYHYYKTHFWDHFNFQDDRLINTPIYDAKLDEYINKEVYPYPDSVEYEAKTLLEKTRGTNDMFKYTLTWFANFAEESKIMGMDEVFVWLVENYYMKGDATWLDNETLQKYIDRAMKIAPNVIGNKAPEVKAIDIDGKEHLLSDVKAKWTLLVFWSADCSHCQEEIPKIDSLYKTVLKAKGMKVYALRTEGDEKKWQAFIKDHHLEDWINVYDPEHKSDFTSKYDVYSTPTIYLLDENKIIRGKKLDHTTIMDVINIEERKAKMKKKQ
jgi:peroxiredoxin